jgi:DNA-binding response OmpR family regulator
VLVVDADDDTRCFLSQVLRDAGYEVLEAATAGAAIELAGGWSLELVLIDEVLPEADGWTLLRSLRQHREHLPCIVVSAWPTLAAAKRSQGAGASAFLAKPFPYSDLLDVCERLLRPAGQRVRATRVSREDASVSGRPGHAGTR